MANASHLSLLKKGVKAWNKWRLKHEADQADLSDADLSNADLSNAHLRNADLSGADLRNADLAGAHLTKKLREDLFVLRWSSSKKITRRQIERKRSYDEVHVSCFFNQHDHARDGGHFETGGCLL
jgi:hypothetical protein